ncbi:metallophosphoesterase [Microbacterium sp. Gd 4-13]|uniref:phosphodiester glycosidase family protein n=1 Tax=Microbacterium sp. Gd 4-13 TaxID=2173179 RepID=UPI000D57DF63|nr:phosphodiester glycosidase family protein [Microbacterium sp. Gd 4-13]PVW02972.1 metallophosphoesterase [Microbacterium sp. Gd 4-13]
MTKQLSQRSRLVMSGIAGWALTAGLVSLAAVPAHAAEPITIDGMNIDSGGTAVVNDIEREAIAPGLIHVSYDRLDAGGWQQIDVLQAELSEETVKMKYLSPETVAGNGGTVTEMVERENAVAGVNLDRFDINNSWAAAGWGIADGEIVKSGNPDATASVGVTSDGLGALVDLVLEGSVTFDDDTTVSITGINVYAMDTSGVALYNSQWGEFSRARALATPDAGVEVQIGADGVVTAVAETVGAGAIADGTQVLVAADGTAAAARLLQLQAGDSAEIAYGVRDDALDIEEAGGAWHRLLTDGEVVDNGQGGHFTTENPRTMIGFDDDRRTAYFVVAGGRSSTADGMVFSEMSALMRDLGAEDAISADGGGSSQMNARLPGDSATSIMNSPSDGYERRDANGLGFTLAQAGSGQLDDIIVDADATGDDAHRVFPGLHRELTATGVDETLSTVDGGTFSWTDDAETVAVEAVDGNHARVLGGAEGPATVTATSGAVASEFEVTVLNELERLTASDSVLSLTGLDDSANLHLTGHDVEGFEAPVEPVDVTVTASREGVVNITDAGDGGFLLTPAVASGGVTLTFAVGDASVQVAVTVGIEERLIINMDEVVSDAWRVTGARATYSVAAGEGRDGGTAARLTYDFTQSTATRTANTRPAVGHPGYEIPGQPGMLKVWVKGSTTSGANAMTYLAYSDATGAFKYVYSSAPQGTEWQQISYPIPAGTAYPIRLQMLSAYETSAANLPAGDMWFDDPVAEVAPEVELPVAGSVTDDTIVADGQTDADPLRVAVMSDAQFVARDPESGQAQGAREALREVVAAKPDVLYINGDLVDEASPEDFVLAKRILDEELANVDFPWTYVPGNHEVMGGAIENFESAFGDTYTSRDIDGTRFITLNTANGNLSSDYAQLPFLRDRLEEAASDESLTGVVVLQHMPIDDPLVTKASQLTDRQDAGLEQDWMEDFRSESGKSIAMVNSHVGVFHSATSDNIPYVINGNSGKDPAASEFGSFTGWTMLGIDPASGDWRNDGKTLADDNSAWFAAEVQTRVESISVTPPESFLEAGEEVTLDPTLLQDDTRRVAVAWPMSYAWTGSSSVHIGAVADAPADAIAALDPRTHRLTALRNGSGDATLTINGVSETVSFSVGAPAPELDVTASVATRTLAGKQYVSVIATNNETTPVDITIDTAYGSKKFTAVQPGKSASVSINSRLTTLPAGEATVTSTGVIDGESVTTVTTASYPAS